MKQSYCDILENVELTPGTMRLTAKDAEIATSSRPGQFVNVLCGQCMDPLLRRPFSIYTVDREEGEFSLLYQVKGRGTVLLAQREAGEKLDVVGPIGRPFHVEHDENIEHILVGGGCGIVPLLFLADVLKEEGRKVTVLIGAQTAGAILCEQEFLERELPVAVSTDDGTVGRKGYVSELLTEHLRQMESSTKPRIYACGPHVMLKAIAQVAANPAGQHPTPNTQHLSPVPCQVSLESAMACGFGVCTGCVVKTRELYCATEGCEDWTYKRVCVNGPVFYTTELVWE